MTDWVDIELDEKTISQGRLYGLIEESDGGLHLTELGSEALGEYFDHEWAKMPICPRCEQKKYLMQGDYLWVLFMAQRSLIATHHSDFSPPRADILAVWIMPLSTRALVRSS